jgi:chloramphenicol O-acetyltransferase type B
MSRRSHFLQLRSSGRRIAGIVLPGLVPRFVLKNARVKAELRRIVTSKAAVYNPSPELLAVAQPSQVGVRLLRYSPDDPQASVGRYCSLNDGSYLLTGGNHHGEYVSTCLFYWATGAGPPESADSNGPIAIGNDVWSGFGSVVFSGVTVGDGAIIGAGAIVTKDVPPYAIVGGIPARIISYRFDKETRAALLRIRWWDWTESKVMQHVDQLRSPEIDRFISRHDPSGRAEFCAACQMTTTKSAESTSEVVPGRERRASYAASAPSRPAGEVTKRLSGEPRGRTAAEPEQLRFEI